jgi:hypothetical protein
VADRIFSFVSTAERLAEAGLISRSDADRWLDGLRTADSEGRFFTSYTGFLVSGIRPDLAQPVDKPKDVVRDDALWHPEKKKALNTWEKG